MPIPFKNKSDETDTDPNAVLDHAESEQAAPSFNRVKRDGYDAAQVDEYFGTLLAHIEALNTDIEALNAQVVAGQEAVDAKEAAIKSRGEEVQTLVERVRTMQGDHEAATGQVEQVSSECAAAKAQAAALTESLRAAEGERDSLQAQVADARAQSDRANAQLRERLSELEAALDEARATASAASGEDLAEARDRVQAAARDLAQARSLISNLENERNVVADRAQRAEAALLHTQSELAQVRAGYDEAAAKVRSLQTEIEGVEAIRDERDGLNERLESLRQSYEGAIQRATVAESDLAAEQQRVAHDPAMLRLLATEQGRSEELQKQLEIAGTNLEALRSQAAESEQRVAQAHAASEALERSVERYRAELDSVQRRYDDAITRAADANAQVEVMRREIQTLREKTPDFGQEADRMMRALAVAREQQESELRDALEQGRIDAESLRDQARREADESRHDAMLDGENARENAQRAVQLLRDETQKILDDFNGAITQLDRQADERISNARDAETEVRQLVKAAARTDLQQIQTRRDELLVELSDLTGRRDVLADELAALGANIPLATSSVTEAHVVESGATTLPPFDLTDFYDDAHVPDGDDSQLPASLAEALLDSHEDDVPAPPEDLAEIDPPASDAPETLHVEFVSEADSEAAIADVPGAYSESGPPEAETEIEDLIVDEVPKAPDLSWTPAAEDEPDVARPRHMVIDQPIEDSWDTQITVAPLPADYDDSPAPTPAADLPDVNPHEGQGFEATTAEHSPDGDSTSVDGDSPDLAAQIIEEEAESGSDSHEDTEAESTPASPAADAVDVYELAAMERWSGLRTRDSAKGEAPAEPLPGPVVVEADD